MKLAITALLCTAIASVSLAEAPALQGLIKPNGAQGIIISGSDFAVSMGSRVCLIAPDWSARYLRNVPTATRPPSVVAKLDDGYVQSIAASPDAAMVSLDEYAVRCHGNKADVVVRASAPQQGKPVIMEHVAFILSPGMLEGARYETVNDEGQTMSGVIPHVQKDKSQRKLLPMFRRAVFHGDLGTITVEVTKGPQVKLDDRRTSIFDDRGPAFIIWNGEIPVSDTGTAEHRLTLTFDYPPVRNPQQLAVKGGDFPAVQRAAETPADFPLVPYPADMRENGEAFSPQNGTKLYLINGTERLQRHAEALAHNWNLTVESRKQPVEKTGHVILSVGSQTDDESYTLECGKNGIAIQAGSERAAFYALQTLRGLHRQGAFKGAVIHDKPVFKYRVVHSMADADTKERLIPLITKVLAPLKINTLLLECPYVTWDSTRGMEHPESMQKSDLVELLKVAQENYIDVWPLIPTYSHSEWLFQNDKNMEMIDNPRDKRAYNPLNPHVYPFLTKLFDEVLETFGHPEFFHISHDELEPEYPQLPEAKAIGLRTLFKNDLLWHYEFFKKRHTKIMIWHDMLVSPKETGSRPVANAREGCETLRRELPRDIRVCVWNYYDPKDGTYPEVEAVVKDELPILGGGWYADGNLEALSKVCQRHHAEGMIVTTWHNKFRSGGLIYTEYKQVHSYVRAASLFWNPDNTLPQPADELLVDLLRKPEASCGTLQGIPFAATTVLKWENPDFDSLTASRVETRDKVPFQLIRDSDQQLCGLCVQSNRLPSLPNKLRIPLQGNYLRLHLLHTLLNRGSRQDNIAVKLVFRYTDGSYQSVYLRNSTDIDYGTVPRFKNDGDQLTYRPDEVASLYEIPSFQRNQYNCVEWQNPSEEPCCLWSYTWRNPHPEKPLDHLLIETQDRNTTYCLLALTGEK